MANSFRAISPHSRPRLSLFVVELTQQCNFRCRYCCYSGQYHDRRVHTDKVMDSDTITDTIKFIKENHCPDRTLRVTFYGGEALLAWPSMKRFVCELLSTISVDIEFGISTNAYLLTPEVVDWICSLPACHVYVSVDGDAANHDANRVTVNGHPTYGKILANLKHFADNYPQKYKDCVDFLVTLESYSQLVGISDFMRSDPFWGQKVPMHLSFVMPRNKDERCLSEQRLQDFRSMLETAFSRYCNGERSLLVNKFVEWTDIFDSSKQNRIQVLTCAEDMYRLFISSEGNVYLCERFNREFMLGTVKDIFDSIFEKALELEDRFISRRNAKCNHCEVASWCTICMTSLNYRDEELADMCNKERNILPLVRNFAMQRRIHERRKQLIVD